PGQTHDLAVLEPEGDPVEGADVAPHGAVVDAEVLHLQCHGYISLSFGLNTSSRPTLVMYSEPTIAVIARPGGTNHHHSFRWSALQSLDCCIIVPSETASLGPRPMKSSIAAKRIAPPNSRMSDISR